MKRFLYTIILMTLIVVLWDPGANLIGKLLVLEEPTEHEITQGEWLSKLAQKHYGDTSYWRELALVNRAPNADLVFPEEQIIVPSFEAIRKIRNARSLSEVNRLVDEQQNILAGRRYEADSPVAQKSTKTEPESEFANGEYSDMQEEETLAANDEEFAESVTPSDEETYVFDVEPYGEAESKPFWATTPAITGFVVLAVIILVGGILFYRNKKREEDLYSSNGKADKSEVEEKGIYDFGRTDSYEDESKKDRNKPVLVK